MLKVIRKLIPAFIKNNILGVYYILMKPRLVRKYNNGNYVLLSNTVDVTHWDKVEFGKNVFIWHFSILDSFNGIRIGDDCQIGARVSIFTHSSHNSIRYYNKNYSNIYFNDHKGRVKGSVEIGDCSFIGANSIIMPGTKIGKGSIVCAFSYVSGSFEDFSIIGGNPAKKIGDVRCIDNRFLKKNPDLLKSYLSYFNIKNP